MTSVLESLPSGLCIVLSENLLGFEEAGSCGSSSSSGKQHPLQSVRRTGLAGGRAATLEERWLPSARGGEGQGLCPLPGPL